MVQSPNEYDYNQDDRVIFLKANVSTYYAIDHGERFYSYLRTEKLSILNGTVQLSAGQSSDSMLYLYAYAFIVVWVSEAGTQTTFIVLVVLCIIVVLILASVLVIRKRS